MPLPKGDNTRSPSNSDYSPLSRPNAAVPTSNPGSERPLKEPQVHPKPSQVKSPRHQRGDTSRSSLRPQTQDLAPRPARAAPPPRGSARPASTSTERKQPSDFGAGRPVPSAVLKIPGPPRPPSRSVRGASVTRSGGLRLFPIHTPGLGAPERRSPAGVPRSGRRGTQMRAPRSSSRGPTPAPRTSEGRIWLAPLARAKADERHPVPRFPPGRGDPDQRAVAPTRAAGPAPPAQARQAPSLAARRAQPLTHPELGAPAHGAGGGKGRAARQARLSGPAPRRSLRPWRSPRSRKARARAAAASSGSPLLGSGLLGGSSSPSLLSKMARGSSSRGRRSARPPYTGRARGGGGGGEGGAAGAGLRAGGGAGLTARARARPAPAPGPASLRAPSAPPA